MEQKIINIQAAYHILNGGLIQIEQTDKSKDKNKGKYKHEDEDTWVKKHPGKEFKPFDPDRKIPYKPSKN